MGEIENWAAKWRKITVDPHAAKYFGLAKDTRTTDVCIEVPCGSSGAEAEWRYASDVSG